MSIKYVFLEAKLNISHYKLQSDKHDIQETISTLSKRPYNCPFLLHN